MTTLSSDYILENLLAGMAISVGVVYGERMLTERNVLNFLVAIVTFLGGWAALIFLDQEGIGGDLSLAIGCTVPVIMFVCQLVYFGIRSNKANLSATLRTLSSAVLFVGGAMGMAAWAAYIIVKSSIHEDDILGGLQNDILVLNAIGLTMLVVGTGFYCAMDPSRYHMGRHIDMMRNNVYNPSLVFITTGWAFLAVANSFKRD